MSKIKILHSADLHLDSPFQGLTAGKAAIRRGEQRQLLSALGILAREEKVDIVLLAGDLLDSGNTYYETGEELARCLGQLEMPVFISPGNHDYYSDKCPYARLACGAEVRSSQVFPDECANEGRYKNPNYLRGNKDSDKYADERAQTAAPCCAEFLCAKPRHKYVGKLRERGEKSAYPNVQPTDPALGKHELKHENRRKGKQRPRQHGQKRPNRRQKAGYVHENLSGCYVCRLHFLA